MSTSTIFPADMAEAARLISDGEVSCLELTNVAMVTSKTVIGRRFVLSGTNPAAATVSAIRVNKNLVLAYVWGAVCYGIAGILLAGFLKNTTVSVGNPYLMSVIAVVIVGGTPLSGGKGTIIGTAISALFLSQLIQLVLTLGAPTATQMLIQAAAIAVAAVFGAFGDRGARSFLTRVWPKKSKPVEHSDVHAKTQV